MVLAVLLAVFLCNTPAVAADRVIVVVGDSISSGYGLSGDPSWVELLKQKLDTQGYEYAVINASIAGDTSAGGLARLPRLLDTHKPEIVIIELGGNDGLRGQSTAQLRKNLNQMIDMSTGAGAEVLLAGMRIPPNYGPAYTQSLERIYPEIAAEKSIELVGFFMQDVALNPGLMQADRIHPNSAGQPVLLENVWPILAPLLN